MSYEGRDFGGSLAAADKATGNILSKFKQLSSIVSKTTAETNKMVRAMRTAFGGSQGGGFNNGGVGSGDAFANFMGGAGNSLMEAGQAMKGKIPGLGVTMQAMGGGLRVAGSVGSMMPDVNATMNRMSQGYNFAVMQGFSGRNNAMRSMMQRSTLSMMGNGLTAPGSDMAVANIMASSGIAYSGDYNSTYMQNLRTVSGLAKYMNVDNEAAAQSMADLTSGATSSMLMRNLGIMTSDPRTGKMFSFKEIAEQFESRVTRGQKFSEKDVLDSYHRGFLGTSLANSGFDPLQQQMILQNLLNKAKGGKGIDFSNPEEMDRLAADNPMLSQYKLNASDTKQMGKAEGAYKTGVDAAVSGLTVLNDVAGDLAATFGALKSSVQTFTGHRAGAGAMSIIQDIGATIGNILGGGSQTMGTAFASSGMSSFSGLGRAYAGAGGGGTTSTTGIDAPQTSSAPQGGSVTTSGAGVTSTNQKRQTSNKRFSCIKPVKGGYVITEYGVKGDRWNGGEHKALDWAGIPEGSPVVAAHDGVLEVIPQHNNELGNHIKLYYNSTADAKYYTGYGHLQGFANGAYNGQTVRQGTVIGFVGRTGTNSDGVHLHFEVWRNGQRVNPRDYLSGEASGAPTGPSETSPTSSGGDAGSSGSGSSGTVPLPISMTSQSQVSISRGSVSTTALDYYASGGGGGTSSTINIDPASSYGYSSAKSGKSNMDVAGSYGVRSSTMSGGSVGYGSKNNVVINLTIARATDYEAKNFAEKVKTYLEEDKLIANMGRS